MTSQESVTKLLADLIRQGVMLWAKCGSLGYKGPKDVLTADRIEEMRTRKTEILEFLEQLAAEQGELCQLPDRGGTQGSSPTAPDQIALAPVTYAQEEYLRIASLCPEEVRRLAVAFRSTAPLNLELLRKSLEEVVRRHDSLRTRFMSIEGAAVQWVDRSAARYHLPVIWVRERTKEISESKARQLLQEFIDQAVRPDTGPLFEVRVFALENHDHLLVLAISHLISDHASIAVLLREITSLYVGFLRGEPTVLPGVPLQMTDLGLQQRQAHSSWMTKHATYWQRRLSYVPNLPLPAATRPLATAADAGPNECPVNLPEQLSKRLRNLSKDLQTTLPTVALTVYVAMLSRWYGQQDLVLTVLVNGRYRQEHEGIVGLLRHNLLLRIQTTIGQSFRDLLADIADEMRSAYEHNDHGLLSTLTPSVPQAGTFNWLPDRTVLDSQSRGDQDDGGSRGSGLVPFPCSPRRASPDKIRELTQLYPETYLNWRLILSLMEHPAGITGSLNFNPALFDQSTAAQLAGQLTALAEEFCSDPQRPIASIMRQAKAEPT